MVIDTSAVLAIFLGEPERKQFLDAILEAARRQISAATVLETGIVLESKHGESAGREFDLFVVRVNLEVVAVDAEQIEIARSAWRSFGKGRHPAGLNFGDCFTYALARSSGEPVLAKGRDFALTDIELCAS
ncbi:MAG: VapC toxin family PIN domain ribonuclease [Acidobacteria bacterium]|nr:MAG: VapC toxin family PIN domain ribonuclease [Acidobacteriota bacterium]PYV76120.1 MAG: VapC toxin family PIN domain ribonuclease [Acidobacteriota bacterium]